MSWLWPGETDLLQPLVPFQSHAIPHSMELQRVISLCSLYECSALKDAQWASSWKARLAVCLPLIRNDFSVSNTTRNYKLEVSNSTSITLRQKILHSFLVPFLYNGLSISFSNFSIVKMRKFGLRVLKATCSSRN